MSLEQEFESIKQFNNDNIDTLFKHLDNSNILNFRKNKKYTYGSNEHFEKLKTMFINGRKIKIDKKQISEPDPALYFAIKTKLKIEDDNDLKTIQEHHNLCMEMENTIGELLEEYIYINCKQEGWIWCSGNIVKSIDFIKKNEDKSWQMLQIKNSDNSENSSSKKVRKGTQIKLWFRRFSKGKKEDYSNWPELSSMINNTSLSEEDFLNFIKNKLQA